MGARMAGLLAGETQQSPRSSSDLMGVFLAVSARASLLSFFSFFLLLVLSLFVSQVGEVSSSAFVSFTGVV